MPIIEHSELWIAFSISWDVVALMRKYYIPLLKQHLKSKDIGSLFSGMQQGLL